MRKIYIFLFVMLLVGESSSAQQPLRIAFDFNKPDTASFSTVLRHAKNLMILRPNSSLEIVCHGQGLDMLLKDKSTVQREIEELSASYHVVFSACEATMKRRGIDKSQLLTQATIVPTATLELALKQQDGWSYIKE
jgi:uncharacterized protein